MPEALAIVIPCRNEALSIAATLDSVRAQDLEGLDWEVIVADGMSDDGTRETLDRYARVEPRLRVIDNPARTVPAGLNAAIREARGEIILRMDAHTAYAPDYVRRCVELLHETGAANVGGPARTRPRGYWGSAIAAAYHSPISCGGARFHNTDYEGWADTVPYGCWRKTTLVALGLFDEQLVRNQDDELNLRLCRAGGRIWQSPSIVSWYQPRGSLGLLSRQYFQYGYWKVAVIRKHRMPASWRHLAPAVFVLLVLLLGWFWQTAWEAMVGAYMLVCCGASLFCGRRHGWMLLPALPAVFVAYHFSYGLGFLAGLALWPFSPVPVFTRVTR
jgi:glycosyltransferase involved in cell wall biosynthesis